MANSSGVVARGTTATVGRAPDYRTEKDLAQEISRFVQNDARTQHCFYLKSTNLIRFRNYLCILYTVEVLQSAKKPPGRAVFLTAEGAYLAAEAM
ncbi:MAG: hypothetical protein ACXWC4_08115 [Telluria sp.]